METEHAVVGDDARSMDALADDSVELVVTSPPYPMIEMWDDLFAGLNPDIAADLSDGRGRDAFERMHGELDTVWSELARVLVEGGIACINVGDATRTVDGSFRVYGNHSRILDAFEDLGFEPLPEVLWRKPANSAAKFMGSGMLPPNAYVTLEHEYVLLLRNGKTQRRFEPGSDRRYRSAYFWEERNRWFSDVWTDVTGEFQGLDHGALRERSAAYPVEIPYRLVNMYSVYGDTVLDPFWGTGTTSLAAMAAGRNSIGYELREEFVRVFEDRVSEVTEFSRDVVYERLSDHVEFVSGRLEAGEEIKHESETYGFPVITSQEEQIQFYTVEEIAETGDGYRAVHQPVEGDDVRTEPTQSEGGVTSSSER